MAYERSEKVILIALLVILIALLGILIVLLGILIVLLMTHNIISDYSFVHNSS